ncbi:MAG TPA: MlaE family lipid ABC transporter permease subunit [Candidatus Azoamicus sp. OHIO2]
MKRLYFLINNLEIIGKTTLDLIIDIGKAGVFLFDIIICKINFNKNGINFIKQFYFIGVLSVGLISISALFIGMVVGLQCYYIIQKFGVEDIIGQLTALTIVRELAPVVSAMLFIGRTGSSLTAEISFMKSTDQLASMEMMGINSIEKLIVPRFWCGLISMLLLALIFIVVSIFGCYISTVIYLNIEHDIFWSSIKEHVNFRYDVLNSLFKSVVFGFIIMWISLFQGLNSNSTVAGMAKATTNTVVYSTFIILGLNFFLTAVMFSWK